MRLPDGRNRATPVGSRAGAVLRRRGLSVSPRFLWECLTSRTVSRAACETRKREKRQSSGASCCPGTRARTREVDEAILGTYLSGANSRRIRKALKPLLGEEHLSKSAVSRVVSRLKERFEEWQNRALSEEVYAIVYLDGFHLKVRMAKRVISVPVLVALGSRQTGTNVCCHCVWR